MQFADLPPLLAQALAERDYAEPTAVQAAVLADEAIGRDLVVSAQTGSGKTVAFGLTMADELLSEGPPSGNPGAPRALVIAPTRELALQVSRELGWLYGKAGAKIATCVGGMNPQQERRALAAGATIVVGTPGRLRDHLERGALDLSALAAVVLDEADEMLDMGFRDDLEGILDGTPDTRRTLLFSATMPRAIERLAQRYQRDALRISTMGADRGHGDIAYQAMTVSPHEVENAVVNLLRLHDADTAMLFCATRDAVRRLHATLQERGFAVVALSGEHSQQERNQAMQALRDRRARVCVATDVAARGIDLPTLSLVVHVEIPRDAETLQHRSGRTGRAGKKGTAVIVVPYNRRKRVESMLRSAKINADWRDAPSREDVLVADRERLLEKLLAPVEEPAADGEMSRVEKADAELAERLLAERTPQQIAAMLVRAHRATMPEAEELTPNTREAQAAAQKERHRPGFEDTVWFRMDIGRRQNADPRWVLPLICRRGHITKNEVGAIRIGPAETHFQIPRALADKFADALTRTADGDDEQDAIGIELSPNGPREMSRQNRKGGPKPGGKKFVKRRGQSNGDGPRNTGPRSDGPRGDGPPKGGKFAGKKPWKAKSAPGNKGGDTGPHGKKGKPHRKGGKPDFVNKNSGKPAGKPADPFG